MNISQAGPPPWPFENRQETLQSYARHVNPGKVQLLAQYGIEVVMGARAGVYFYDAYSERKWLNCHCNGGVFNLGHRHPRILEAVRAGLEYLDIGNHHLVSGHKALLAQRLAATTGNQLPGVVFGVSGGEAVDLAIKLARAVTGREKIISAQGGYHGHTGLALAAGDAQYREPFGQHLPGFVQVPFNDLAALQAVVDDNTAAVILETIPATLGMPIPQPGYLVAVAQLCRARGAKLLLDEVQSGLGRTGRIWAYQHEELQPDMLITGKGLGGGIFPITATLMTEEIHAFFAQHPFIHISTLGGADLACVAALAVLDIIEEPGFLERVQSLAQRFAAGLTPLPLQLRQRGLMMGLEFSQPEKTLAVARQFYQAGIFTVWANNDPRVLQFLPPLIINDDEVTWLLATISKILA